MSRVVAIVGSRDFSRLSLVDEYIATLPAGTLVVSGGARGVDRRAVVAAERRGLPTHEIEADWDRYGKQAGLIRNGAIVVMADKLVAFWDGESRGTMDTVRKARVAGKEVEVIRA